MEMCQVIAPAGCFDSLSEGTEGVAAVNEASISRTETTPPWPRSGLKAIVVQRLQMLSSEVKGICPLSPVFSIKRGMRNEKI